MTVIGVSNSPWQVLPDLEVFLSDQCHSKELYVSQLNC